MSPVRTQSLTAAAVTFLLAFPALAQAPASQSPPAPKAPPAPAQPAPAATQTAPARPPAGSVPAPAAAPSGQAPAQPQTAAQGADNQPQPKLDANAFDGALKDYFDNKQERAARTLYAFIESTPPTDENYAWAQYFLAALPHRPRTCATPARSTWPRWRTSGATPRSSRKTLEALKVLTLVPHDEVLIDEQIFGSLDLGFLPESVSDYANYQQGLVDLRVGNERWAKTHFVKLEDGSVEASRAKFALLVTRLKNAKAVDDQMIDDFLELSKDEKLTQEARNEARLAVARLRYERKDFEGALKAYDMVQLPSLDPGPGHPVPGGGLDPVQPGPAPGDHRPAHHPGRARASGTSSSPTSTSSGRWSTGTSASTSRPSARPRSSTRRFSDSLEAIRERDDLTQDFRLRRAATSHGATKRAARFLESLDLEGERLGRYAGGFGDRLYEHLDQALRPGRTPRPSASTDAAPRGGGARGGGQAAARRRAGAPHGVRGRPQALRARQARRQARPAGEGDPLDLRPGRLQVRRRVLERRAPQLPGRASRAVASRRAPSDRGPSSCCSPPQLRPGPHAPPTLDKSVNPVVTKQREKTEYVDEAEAGHLQGGPLARSRPSG